MWPLIRDVFSKKDAGVRALRYGLMFATGVGVHVQATGALPDTAQGWVAVTLAALPGIITKQPQEKK